MMQTNRILYGGDYNPDQWSPAVWREDMALMQALGVNTVTLPVFSWAKLQTAVTEYNFGWLDDIMGLLHDHDIQVIMATPTAAQPAWMSRQFPDILPVNIYGLKHQHGGRCNFCVNSPSYRRFSANIAAKLAERYGRYDNLILWHVNNEYGTYCYCDNCAAAFRVWLQARYGTLDELNRCWTTSFWGHTLYDWDEIVPPSYLSGLLPNRLGNRDGATNQTIAIDYMRFMSDSIRDCLRNEVAAIRTHTPHVPITTNLMGTFKPVDYFSWMAELDVVSWDNYPSNNDPVSWSAMRHDLMRGVNGGRPFLLMEQTPSQQNWQPYNALKRPGVMRLWSYQAIAHGSDSVLFFQWRQSQGACEKYHAAMVPHVGHLQTRIGRELAQLGAELPQLSALVGSQVQARVGILFDWPNWWAVEYSSGPSQDLDYPGTVHTYYQALYEQNIAVDMLPVTADLSPYDLIIAPMLYMVSADCAARIKKYVAEGGVFVTTCFSGLADEHDRVILGGYPGAFRDLLGIWIEETDALYPDVQNEMVFAEGEGGLNGRYACGLLCDVLHLEGAQVRATFGQDYYTGSPSLTENSYGNGKAIYIATQPAAPLLRDLLADLCRRLQIAPPFTAPAGVEVRQRRTPEQTYTFVLNHNSTPATLSLDKVYWDILAQRELRGSVLVNGRDVLMLGFFAFPPPKRNLGVDTLILSEEIALPS